MFAYIPSQCWTYITHLSICFGIVLAYYVVVPSVFVDLQIELTTLHRRKGLLHLTHQGGRNGYGMFIHQRYLQSKHGPLNADKLLVGGFKHDWIIFHVIYGMGCHPKPIDEVFHIFQDGHIAPPSRSLLTMINHD